MDTHGDNEKIDNKMDNIEASHTMNMTEKDNTEKPDIILFNTLKKEKEIFKPISEGHVDMYHCGPTVYNYIHVGNLRAFIVADLVRRLFEFNGYTVKQIMNVTDIGHLQSDADDGEDKMTLALKREGKELSLANMRAVADKFYNAFRFDLDEVNVLPAHLYPFASEHIAEDILFIEKLISGGHAYTSADGVYFDTNSIANYGRLGGVSNTEKDVRSRIDDASSNQETADTTDAKYAKKNFRDFAVWKFNPELGYDASFGKGFPGWHIECSVMSNKYLGEKFDIHTGGVDHIFVHHNNEIAQCEALSHEIMANYWLHNEHVIIDGGKKMAKSGESFITLDTLKEKGISPIGFRYWLLGASYRTQMQFSFEAIQQAEQGYKNLVSKITKYMLQDIDNASADSKNEIRSENVMNSVNAFKKIINDDINTAKAIAYIHEDVLGNENLNPAEKIEIIKVCDSALGLSLIGEATRITDLLIATEDIPVDITKIAEERSLARKEKNWSLADKLRDELLEKGFEVKDTDEGYTLSKRLV